MIRVIGREDEFRLEYRNSRKKYNMDKIGIGITEILEKSGIEIEDDTFISGGKFEYGGSVLEVTTPAVRIKKLASHHLTLSTLAHRMALIYGFRKYCKKSEQDIILYGWTSHDNVSINYKGFLQDRLAKTIACVLKLTTGPVLIALNKAKMSCYPVGVGYRSSGKQYGKLTRLHFYEEYIPDPVQLSAANGFLVGSVGKLESLIKKFLLERYGRECIKLKYNTNKFRRLYRDLGLQIDADSSHGQIFWLSDTSQHILNEGLSAKIGVIDRRKKKISKRQVTVGYLFQYWLDFFYDDIKPLITEAEMKALKDFSKGDRKLALDYEWPEHHYDIDESYFKTFTLDTMREYFRKKSRIGLKGWCD